jgi:hypothetical protein
MGFEKHLFISYAHIDNQPLTPEQQGWISRFHASLKAMLSMRLGGPAEIWRDEKLRGNDIFAREIVEQFPHTALLVSVLTPRYLNSEWCTREVQEFCKSAQHTGGLVVENKARILKVIKTPADTEEALPEVMKEVLGYEFFTFEDGTPLELDPAYGEKFAQEYNRKVGKLAWDAAQLLKKLAADTRSSVPDRAAPATTRPTAYLAECSYDRREAREMLESDLRLHGYTVLPEHPLPREEADYVAAVERILGGCALSIHLVGESYGAVPDGPSQKSLVVLQNELAVQRSKSGALARVIWLRQGTASAHAQQQAFITALHQDAEAQFGADLITGDLEACKAAIHAALKKLEKPEREKSPEPVAAADTRLIYLLCDEKDRKATVPLRKFCREQGWTVALPAFEGDATAVREANQNLLTTCDAVILFYGAGGDAWKRTIDNELKKMPGYRGGKPLLASYTYLADPRTSDKDDLLDMEEPNLIKGLGGFVEAEMAMFMQAMSRRGVTA